MKTLLITAFGLLFSLSALAQSAKRVYYVGDNQISVDNADGSNGYLRDVSAVSVTPQGSSIAVSIGAAIYTLAPAEFLNSAGTAYGATVTDAYAAFKASKPASGGGGGATTVTVSQTATFGTTPPTQTIYTTTSGTITTTNVIRVYVENAGAANATFTYGSITYTLEPKDAREFVAYVDPTSGKLTPFLAMSGNGTGTTLQVTRFFKQ